MEQARVFNIFAYIHSLTVWPQLKAMSFGFVKQIGHTGCVTGAVLSLFSAVSVTGFGTALTALSRSMTSGGGGSGLWCKREARTCFLLFTSTIKSQFSCQTFQESNARKSIKKIIITVNSPKIQTCAPLTRDLM